jgi:hypothetical protein
MLDEVERSLHDALCVIKVSCRNPVSFTVCTLLLMLIIANLPPCLWVRPSFHGIVELRRGSLVEGLRYVNGYSASWAPAR